MPHIPAYICEFDTIKNRNVRIEIDKFRRIDPIIARGGFFISFLILDSKNVISFLATTRDLFPGDQLIVSDTASNDGTYTISKVQIGFTYIINDVIYFDYVLEVNESITVDFDKGKIQFIPNYVIKNIIASTQSPLEISYPNGKFDKNCPIRESKIRLKLLTGNISYTDFIAEFDNQFLIRIYIENQLQWAGYLDNDYITQPFLDTKTEIELSGNDGLSLLKSKPLRNLNGEEVWSNSESVFQFIRYSLDQTGLDLDFWSFINMYAQNAPVRSASNIFTWNNDIFTQTIISSQTFLKGPREFDDCYEVLSKIMQAFGCTLYQAHGHWYIIQTADRIRNVLGGSLRLYPYSSFPFDAVDNISFAINVGLTRDVKLINADALLSVEKPFSEVVVKYSYDPPPIYFRNFDLLDSEVRSTTPSKITGYADHWNSSFPFIFNYYLFTFQLVLRTPLYANIVVELEAGTGSEIIRYLALKGGFRGEIGTARSTEYLINAGDRIALSYTCRYTIPVFEQNRTRCAIILVGNNNEVRYLDQSGVWTSNYMETNLWWAENEDRTFWKRFNPDNIHSQGAPFSGYVSVQFIGEGPEGDYEIHFKDLSFNVIPNSNLNVNASGYEYKSENIDKTKNLYDVELFMSNSDNISVKGALYTKLSQLIPVLLKNFKHISEDDTKLVPFAKYITRSYWRSMYRRFNRVEGRLFGLYNDNKLLSPLNTILFDSIPNQEYMITTLQMDIRQESAEFSVIELRNTLNDEFDFTGKGKESYRLIDQRAKDYDNPIKEPKTPIDYKWGVFGHIAALVRRNKIRRFNNYS